MKNIIIGASSGEAVTTVAPEGVSFDGVTDYLSRSSDFVGNVDSKTFTFSCWVYYGKENLNGQTIVYESGSLGLGPKVQIYMNGGKLEFVARNSSGSYLISLYCQNLFIKYTWTHILISIDTSNQSKTKIYLNDTLQAINYNAFTLNTLINFKNTSHAINGLTYNNTASLNSCRLSNLFLAYTYRDLSIEANRRLFITADGKPADWNTTKALNGILMLPMKDASTCHINDGYGGNLVQNGTLDTASRGANQDNCVASLFNGTSQYLSRTSLTGASQTKILTISFIINPKNPSQGRILTISNGTYSRFQINATTNAIELFFANSANTQIVNASIPIINNRSYSVQISFDLSNTSFRKVVINGIVVNAIWNTYINDFIDISQIYVSIANIYGYSLYFNGNIGELYFNTTYTDLATNNPFWDSVENRPVPVRKVIQDTGIVPLIAMPLDASNAGKNYGTGGDFTVNSGPFVGARGGSEFWARSAKFDGVSYFQKTLSSPIINVGKCSGVISFVANNTRLPLLSSGGFSGFMDLYVNNNTGLYIAGNAEQLKATISATFVTGSHYTVIFSFDLSDVNKRSFTIVNNSGVLPTTPSYTSYVNYTKTISSVSINYREGFGQQGASQVSMCYFTTDYIDFSQEVNRNKFVDQLGYPKDLAKQIEAGVIPTPLIYLPFDDTSNLGKNLGTGGDFTINGTVTQGSDFSI